MNCLFFIKWKRDFFLVFFMSVTFLSSSAFSDWLDPDKSICTADEIAKCTVGIDASNDCSCKKKIRNFIKRYTNGEGFAYSSDELLTVPPESYTRKIPGSSKTEESEEGKYQTCTFGKQQKDDGPSSKTETLRPQNPTQGNVYPGALINVKEQANVGDMTLGELRAKDPLWFKKPDYWVPSAVNGQTQILNLSSHGLARKPYYLFIDSSVGTSNKQIKVDPTDYGSESDIKSAIYDAYNQMDATRSTTHSSMTQSFSQNFYTLTDANQVSAKMGFNVKTMVNVKASGYYNATSEKQTLF